MNNKLNDIDHDNNTLKEINRKRNNKKLEIH